MKKTVILLLAFSILLLSACQAAPDDPVVSSKNDGRFDDALNTENDGEGGNTAETIDYVQTFTSTDGKITYNINVPGFVYPGPAMPVVQVTPSEITIDDAQRIASVLFGGATLYEYGEVLSKAEIEEQIALLQAALTDEALYADYGPSKEDIELGRQARQAQLDYYLQLYETASESGGRQECQWTFFPASHYDSWDSSGDESYNKTLCLRAVTDNINGTSYNYFISNRDETDFRTHTAEAWADNWPVIGSEEPTAEQLEAVSDKVREMIGQMDIGQWKIDKICSVTYGEGYMIGVSAVPVYEGWAVTHQNGLSGDDLKSGDIYASNYNYPKIGFYFTVDGTLISFQYDSPLCVVDVVNERTAILSLEELQERITRQLSLTDISAYVQTFKGDGSINVEVNEMVVGLTRIRIKDNAEDFYLVPSVTLRGNYLDHSADEWYAPGVYDGNNREAYGDTVLVLNLVDGSVINVENGY